MRQNRHSSRRQLRAAGAGCAVLAVALAGCGSAGHSPAARPGQPGTTGAALSHHAGGPSRPVSPLTGLPISAAAARRPVLAVKIDNVPGAFPQWGINAADMVVEEVVEGGLTRLVAEFQSRSAPRVGPVRSARPVDADLERLWNGGILAYSGAAPLEIKPSIDHGHALLENATTYSPPFSRLAGYYEPHNLFSSTAALYRGAKALAAAQHKKIGIQTQPLFDIGTPSGRHARSVSLTFSPFASALWRYDPSKRRYLRWQNGTADVVGGSGDQMNATNVVVAQVHLQTTPIVDDAGNHDPLDVVLGKGRTWVFSHGTETAGQWSRPTDADPMRLTGGSGKPIALAPGVTWIELLPVGHTPSVS